MTRTFPEIPLRPSWCEIDLDAVAHNYRELRRGVGPEVAIYACLKGDAYGMGAVPVARVLEREGAEALAFGSIIDAIRVREAGVKLPVLLYPNCLPDAANAVRRHGFAITLSDAGEVGPWEEALDGPVDAFVKIDIGAFRAGALPGQSLPLLKAVSASPRLRLKGVYGHLHYPDRDEAVHSRWQFDNIRRAIDEAGKAGIALPIRMVAASSVVQQYPEMDLNAVDPGRMLYGVRSTRPARALDLRPALRAIKTRLIMRKSLSEADPGPFPPPFPIRKGMVLGLLPFGWGDGFARSMPKNAVALIRGKRVALVGPAHFEHLRIDLTDVPEATLGDEVVLLGEQGDERISLEEAAETWGSDSTTFIGKLPDRLPRIYRQAGRVVGIREGGAWRSPN